MYCDFLDSHLITDLSLLKNDKNNKYEYLMDLSNSVPTPKTMELSIFKLVNKKDEKKLKNEIINYCLFFGDDKCNYIESKIKKYDPDWRNYFPLRELKIIRTHQSEV